MKEPKNFFLFFLIKSSLLRIAPKHLSIVDRIFFLFSFYVHFKCSAFGLPVKYVWLCLRIMHAASIRFSRKYWFLRKTKRLKKKSILLIKLNGFYRKVFSKKRNKFLLIILDMYASAKCFKKKL